MNVICTSGEKARERQTPSITHKQAVREKRSLFTPSHNSRATTPGERSYSKRKAESQTQLAFWIATIPQWTNPFFSQELPQRAGIQ
jgi:hypothetical protein